jgi:ferrous iron transport protein B
LVWILANLPPGVEYGSIDSVIGIIGSWIAPIFAPLGFGFWQAAVAIVFGLMAKEIVVSTFGTLFSLADDDEEGISGVLSDMFTPLSSISFMIFCLLYPACFAALGAIKEESNSWKWMMASVAICTVIAYVLSLIVYQGGLLLGFA